MLEPDQRRFFLDTLRPPDDYRFDRAVGTTFTLDLLTLLSVPLAFTFRDAHDGNGELASDPLALLESARQNADRILLFCQGGRTSVPRSGQHALAFIEGCVVPVFPPYGGAVGAIFHPKIWVLRYTAPDRPVRYRLVCQSRNLTFDTSWDASLVLDGKLNDERVRGFGQNRPLADFVQALPRMAAQPISAEHQKSIDLLSTELRRVEFTAPKDLLHSRFLPFGTGRSNDAYPDLFHRRLLVISPFLDGEFLKSAVGRRKGTVLISRREELLKAPRDAVCAFDKVFAFRPSLEPESEDTDDIAPLAGLHAKIYVMDDGHKARIAVGSANSTGAALGNPPRNVEFMVELVGSKKRFGIDALLSPGKDGEAGTFSSLIEEFNKHEAGTVAEDQDEVHLVRLLDSAADVLARADIGGQVTQASGGRFTLGVDLPEQVALPPEVTAVRCWPATLPHDNGKPLEDGCEFTGLSLEELSTFLAIEVSASTAGMSERKRFVRPVSLSGLPEDRLQQLLARMLSDRSRLMQLLWLLLSPVEDLSFGEFTQALGSENGRGDWGSAMPGMLERMLETLGRSPDRLDAVAALLADLKKTETGAELVDDEFEMAWSAIWKVREATR
ncbi:MAG: phospholipase D family protein [Chloroflexota bacterium]|nr:phospholipase D family protein [Chloroflexota bacterium]